MSTINRNYLIDLITKIINSEGTEEELNTYIEELIRLSPMPDVTDLIFYPEKDDVSAEAIANAIINFKPKFFLQ